MKDGDYRNGASILASMVDVDDGLTDEERADCEAALDVLNNFLNACD